MLRVALSIMIILLIMGCTPRAGQAGRVASVMEGSVDQAVIGNGGSQGSFSGRLSQHRHSQSPTTQHSSHPSFNALASSLPGSQGPSRRRVMTGGGVLSSAVTSADSSDAEDELPSAGLVAPFAVLRGYG